MTHPDLSDSLAEAVRELARAGLTLARDQRGLTVTTGQTPWRVWRSRRDNGAPGPFYATRPPSPWREPRTVVADTAAELTRQLTIFT